jgi:hypothetical protein
MAKRGFTSIPHGFHARIAEFKDGKSYARLAVWLYHRAREGRDGTSYPSIPRMASDLDLKDNTVSEARTWLRANGWLTTVGHRDAESGRYAVPVERTAIPPINGVGDHTLSTGMDQPPSTGLDPPRSSGDGFNGVISSSTALRKHVMEPVEVAATPRSAAQRVAALVVEPDAPLHAIQDYLEVLIPYGYEQADLVDMKRIWFRVQDMDTDDTRVLFTEWLPKAAWVLKATQGRIDWLADRFESDDKRSLLNQFRSFIDSRKRYHAETDPGRECPYMCGAFVTSADWEAHMQAHTVPPEKRYLDGEIDMDEKPFVMQVEEVCAVGCTLPDGHIGDCKIGEKR